MIRKLKLLLPLCFALLLTGCFNLTFHGLEQDANNKDLYHLNVYPSAGAALDPTSSDTKAQENIQTFMDQHPEYKSYKIVGRTFSAMPMLHYAYTIRFVK